LTLDSNSRWGWLDESTGLLYREGSISEIPNFDPMFNSYFDEVVSGVDKEHFAPNKELIKYYESTGFWVSIGIQLPDKSSAGWACYVINPHMYISKALVGCQYLLYILPEHRSYKVFKNFYKFVETLLRDIYHITYIISSSGVKRDLGPLFKRMNYIPYDMTYIKRID